ncbi:MAG TPA: DUF5618 family protein [Candidatus Kapabacteria bacterium]|nr:DUF5618 family protein [Candidatus Kapabacteria bacterium]
MKTKNAYKEAMRYIENARETLKLAGKDGKFYADEKYVKTASGTAYSGTLVALDYLFDVKNVPKRRGRKSIDYYKEHLGKIDKKLLKELNSVYNILHLNGYYEGETNIKSIEAGFDNAIDLIDSIKQYCKNGNGVSE